MNVTGSDKVILIVEDDAERGAHLQGLIEFMDAPHVVLGDSGSWESLLGTLDLAAVFIGGDLPDDASDRLFDRLHETDPNIPVVVVDGAGEAVE